MYGWRGKIGLIIPANNTVIEPELGRAVPDGVAAYATRMIVEGPFGPEALDRMQKQATRCIDELALSQVDVAVYACMSTSLAKGPQWDDAFRIQAGKGMTLVTAAGCTLDALRAVGVRKVAILSPYPPTIQPLVRPYFEQCGFSVVSSESLNISDYKAVTQQPPELVYRHARVMRLEGADGVCILATDLPTMGMIASLERDLGSPVVSTNLAALWGALKALGIRDSGSAPRCALMNSL